MMLAFLLCQLYVVLFIALHDWLPLGRLNNLASIRVVNTKQQLLRTTILSTLPFAVGLIGSVYYSHGYFPMWLPDAEDSQMTASDGDWISVGEYESYPAAKSSPRF
jgi:hypothetical protein